MSETHALNLQPAAPAAAPGRVALVGAGPGDPGLLTVRALERLRGATAIVHDALVGGGVRAHFPPGAAVYDAGKRAGTHTMPQAEINALLARLALEGHAVVRLKGGDPFVFGRGGEELAHLTAQGIPVELVPGVSAPQAAAAATRCALTHRGRSAACTVLNGHAAALESLPWAALVALGGTWVFLMAKASAGAIAARLLDHGAPAELGMAVVENASLPAEHVTVAPLAHVAAHGYTPQSGGPGLVLAGPTIAARPGHLFTLLAGAAQPHERPVSDLSVPA